MSSSGAKVEVCLSPTVEQFTKAAKSQYDLVAPRLETEAHVTEASMHSITDCVDERARKHGKSLFFSLLLFAT